MKHSTGKPTKAEAARMAAIKAMHCVACVHNSPWSVLVFQPHETECHHLLSGNKRRGHLFTIPLCAWHHRGFQSDMTVGAMEFLYGPSLARTSKKFRAKYGSDDELLSRTNQLLENT